MPAELWLIRPGRALANATKAARSSAGTPGWITSVSGAVTSSAMGAKSRRVS
jgi:hypothetical protein